MKKTRYLAAAAMSCALAAFCILNSCSGQTQTVSKAEDKKEAVTVQVMEAASGEIQSEYSYSGRVRPVEEVNVVGTVPGLVDSIEVSVGDTVKKDQVLCRMDTRDIKNNLAVLSAQLAAAKAGVKSAQTSVELVNGASMQVQIMNAKAGLDQAKLAYDNAATALGNSRQLYEAGVISKSDFDKASTGMKNTEIAYQQAQQSYDLVSNRMPAENLRRAKDGLAAAQASQHAVEAQIASAEKTLSDAELKSPLAGTVTSCALTKGGLYSQAAGAAFVIGNLEQVSVTTGVSEQIINTLQAGQKAEVLITAASAEPFSGTISEVSPAVGQTGTYQVKVLLDNPKGVLKSGMLGEVRFVRERKENAVVLPRSAVLSDGAENFVFAEENGKAKKLSVKLGIDTGEQVEISDGVPAGSHVIVKGQSFLKDGDAVTVSDSGAKGE